MRADFVRRPGEDHFAGVEHGHPIAEGKQEPRLVLDDDHRDAVPLEVGEDLGEMIDLARGQARRRLVQDNDVRARDADGGELGQLLDAVRNVADYGPGLNVFLNWTSGRMSLSPDGKSFAVGLSQGPSIQSDLWLLDGFMK